MKKLRSILVLLFITAYFNGFGQCGPTVPQYVINLSANADTTWTLKEVDALPRNGLCCSATGSSQCIQFQITLHPNAAGIFFDYDGAGAFGSLNWRVNCGPMHNLKDTICLTGAGPFTLTFCKPGNDNGNYTLTSVSKPTFPDDQVVPLNCAKPLHVTGVRASTVTWQSISPGAPGAYNNLLSCTNCLDPVYTPNPNGPAVVQYRVCGYPILKNCVGNILFCDTVKITSLDSIKLNVTPINPSFCSGGNVNLTASATGGDGNFTYSWYNASLALVGTGPTYNATAPGSYTCKVKDGNYDPLYCDQINKTVIVVEASPPVVNAGSDQILCATSPVANISASVQNATGGMWTGGTGTYSPSSSSINMSYTPTTAEIASGSVTLTLTSTGAGSSCSNVNDQVQIFYIDTIKTNLADTVLGCFGATTLINPTITGGLAPITYLWADGTSTANNTLGAGTHCLMITDNNGCQTTECLTISTAPELNVSTSSTPALTNGGSTGTATASPSGGTSPYAYSWSNTGTTPTITGLNYGIYTIMVTDDAGCIRQASVVVNEPRCNGFSINTSSTNVLCNSDSTGTASVSEVGGLAPFTYSWNDINAQTTPTATNLPAGVYEISVMDDNGCYAISTASIFQPAALSNTMTHGDVSVLGGSDGSAQSSVIGGFGSYSYLWSNTDITADISGVSAGWYHLEVTDDNNCMLMDSVLINEPPCNQFQIYVSTVAPVCNGVSTGSANLSITNGTGPYSINWSTGESNIMSISGKMAGIYTVEVTDNQGCYTFLNFGISQPSPLSIGLASTPSTCNGSNNGTIDMTVNGGTYPYYYFNWSNGQTTEDLQNLPPGLYSVTVQDENGCIATKSATLTDPGLLTVIVDSTKDVTCFEGSDGEINVSITGGNPTYSYNWSNGATSQDLSGIDVGGYILDIVDGNFCKLKAPITILVNQPAQVLADTIIVSCPLPGELQTLVDITPKGGTSNYAISTDGGTSYGSYGVYSVMLNTGQSYNVVVKDVKNCVSPVYPISIAPTLSIDDVDFNVCYAIGQTDEMVNVDIIGGLNDYYVSSDNGVTYGSQGVTSINAPINNSYDIVAMDANGCVSLPFPIVLPDVFDVNISVTSDYNGQDVSCFGYNDGEATAVPSGGTGAVTYSWSNSCVTAINSNLVAGTYDLTIEDAAGCTFDKEIIISQPTAVSQSYSTSSNPSGNEISCFGFDDGSIDYTISGGVGGYTFDWNNDGTGDNDDSEDLSGLTAGTYIVIGTDLNGCTVSQTVTLTEPSELSQSYSTSVNPSGDAISCYGFNDGSINYTLSGGAGGYIYDWDNDGTGDSDDTEDLNSLLAGQYIIAAMDMNGCLVTETITLSQPTLMVQDGILGAYASGNNISCNGFNNGSIDYSISGGSAGYVFNWSSVDGTGYVINNEDQADLTAGIYMVSVVDMNGCALDSVFALTEPTEINQSYTVSYYSSGDNISCYGYDDGFIDFTVTGGSGGYVYDWDIDGTGDFDDSEDLSDITAGEYLLTGMDLNGCIINATVTLIEPSGPSQSVLTSVHPSGNAVSCFNSNDGWIDYTVIGGAAPYTYDWDNDGIGDNDDDEDLSNLPAGTYNLTATDVNGCSLFQTVILLQPDSLMLSGLISHVKCYNDLNGSIDVTLQGGTEPYNYTWNTGNDSQDIANLGNGVYTLSISDSMGCIQNGQYAVDQPDSLMIDLSSPVNFNDDHIDFFGGNNGEIDATVFGGTAPYSYSWSTGESNEDISLLVAGTYELIVYDENGCSAKSSILLREPLYLELPSAFSPNTDNANDLYVIRGIDAYPDNTFTVINRWGNVVHESKGYSNTWGGENADGKLLPDGVYFAILVINGGEIERTSYVQIKTH